MPIDAVLAAAKSAHQAGRRDDAKAGYLAVLAKDPAHVETLYLLGALLAQEGEYSGAERRLKECLAVMPDHGAARDTLGIAQNAMRQAAANDAIRNAVDLRNKADWPAAEAAYRQAIDLNPNHAALRDELGSVLFNLGRYDDGETVIRSAIALDPDAAHPYTNLGRLLLRKPDGAADALRHHDVSISKQPNLAGAHCNRSAALYALDRIDEAVAAALTALSLNPHLAEARSNLGNALYRRGDIAAAIEQYSEALRLNPTLPEPAWNRGLARLTLGQFRKGWEDFDARWRCSDFMSPDRGMGLRRLSLADPPGTRVLVWGEQGIGDEILFGTMAPSLAAQGYKVFLECDPRLASLWQRSVPNLFVVPRDTDVAAVIRENSVTHQIPAGSLGAFVRMRAEDFAAGTNVLKPDQTRAQQFRQKLASPHRPLIGISWRSRSDDVGAGKSITLKDWRELLALQGTFVSLQYGDVSAEVAALGSNPNADLLIPPDLDATNDLDGLAALISACDAVVTVSNVTAHLAGALGRPTWVLAPSGAGRFWYWQADRSDTPVYPSVRIVRQTADGSWSEAIKSAADALASKLAFGHHHRTDRN